MVLGVDAYKNYVFSFCKFCNREEGKLCLRHDAVLDRENSIVFEIGFRDFLIYTINAYGNKIVPFVYRHHEYRFNGFRGDSSARYIMELRDDIIRTYVKGYPENYPPFTGYIFVLPTTIERIVEIYLNYKDDPVKNLEIKIKSFDTGYHDVQIFCFSHGYGLRGLFFDLGYSRDKESARRRILEFFDPKEERSNPIVLNMNRHHLDIGYIKNGTLYFIEPVTYRIVRDLENLIIPEIVREAIEKNTGRC